MTSGSLLQSNICRDRDVVLCYICISSDPVGSLHYFTFFEMFITLVQNVDSMCSLKTVHVPTSRGLLYNPYEDLISQLANKIFFSISRWLLHVNFFIQYSIQEIKLSLSPFGELSFLVEQQR